MAILRYEARPPVAAAHSSLFFLGILRSQPFALKLSPSSMPCILSLFIATRYPSQRPRSSVRLLRPSHRAHGSRFLRSLSTVSRPDLAVCSSASRNRLAPSRRSLLNRVRADRRHSPGLTLGKPTDTRITLTRCRLVPRTMLPPAGNEYLVFLS
jgi:hypothetical protein